MDSDTITSSAETSSTDTSSTDTSSTDTSSTDTSNNHPFRLSLVAGATFLFASAALVLLTGCGGGGGGGGGTPAATHSNATFAGTYRYATFSISQASGRASAWMSGVSADGAGSYTVQGATSNLNGTLLPVLIGGPTAYAVASDGGLDFNGRIGGISADGRMAVIANVANGSSPTVGVMVRESAGQSAAAFTGGYHLAGMASDDGTNVAARWTEPGSGLVTFDGVGDALYPPINTNLNGVISTVPGGNAGYGIAATGLLDTDSTWFADGTGGIRDDGLAGFVGGGASGGDPFIKFMVRESAGLTNSTWQGEYWVVGLTTEPSSSNAARAFFATLTVDGAGFLTFSNTQLNNEGVAGPIPDSGSPYSVASNGAITSGDMRGAITADGSFGYVCGEADAMSTPSIFIFVRKQ